jgi:serine phosphatase RsbU (regulator of sigma subunit)/integral membrane sensor domain MASE1
MTRALKKLTDGVVILQTVAIAAAYAAGAQLGFFLASMYSQVSPIWPPEGIALAALLLLGNRALPGILLGAILANYLNNPNIPSAVLIGIGNTGGAWLNSWLIRRFAGVDLLASTASVLRFLVVIPAGSALSASVGVTSLVQFGFVQGEAFMDVWLTWFFGEMEGFLIVAPLLVTYSRFLTVRWELVRLLECLAFLVVLCLISYISFSRIYPLYYLPIPVIILFSLRFGEFGATLGAVILSGFAVMQTVGGRGPFSVYTGSGTISVNSTLILLDLFIFTVTVTSYILVAVARERQAALEDSIENMIAVERIKDQANRELEARVIERTRIIARQKQELEDQIAMAQTIQMALLPDSVIQIPRCIVDFKYQPMMKIGGDFVDVRYDASSNSLGLFICDVTGHGVPAALVAALVKMSLNDWYTNLSDVSGALLRIQSNLKDKMGEHFITACVAHVNLTTGELTTARAGHHPLIVLRPDGRTESIRPRGRMLMAHTSPNSEVGRAQLSGGDRVLLYTDGLTEAVNPAGELIYPEDRLFTAVSDRSRDVHTLCNTIFRSVLDESGGEDKIEDDITFLLMEYLG